MTITKGMKQAYDVQDFAYEALMALQAATKEGGKQKPLSKEDAAAFGTLGKVWKDAQEQIRIHRGKPLPGSLTHEKVRAPRATRAKLGVLSALASELSEPRPHRPSEHAQAEPGEHAQAEPDAQQQS